MRVGESEMGKRFKVSDHVTWNSEAGHVSGRIIKVHSKDVDYKGHTHHASEDEPQYEIKSDKTDHIAMHKGSALKKLRAT
jgi:Hypervirulence associated proteins TUDOR domain